MQPTIAATKSLFEQGYRVRASARLPLGLIVRKPDGVTRYTVDMVGDTCTCKAGENGRNCKHRKEMKALVMEQWAQVNDKPGHEQQMYLLMLRWEEICQARKAQSV